MAIKIPIITIFDNKGLRAAQYQLNKVSGSFSALGRNFAIAGAAVGTFAAGLGMAVKAASNFEAEFEGVNQVFGKAAKSVQAFAEAAAKTAGLSETAALQGAKTFGLFAKSAGLGEKEAAKFATTLVQLAGDLGSFNDVPTEEALAAIQSGLMGQAEPLRKFGVFLTDTKLRAEAMAMEIYDGTGALNDQQKMLASYSLIMKDTQIQQGDFVKYQDTFGNSFKTVQTEIQNITKDIGMELLPVIAEVTPIIGDLAREFGGKLAEAVRSVDWKSVIGSVVEFLTFIVRNIEEITRLATTLFLLNTAFNAVRATAGLVNAGIMILNSTFTITAGKITLTTGALKLFRTALITTGVGALVVGLGFLLEAMNNTTGAAEKAVPKYEAYGTAIVGTGAAASWAAGKYGVAQKAAKGFAGGLLSIAGQGKAARHALRELNREAGKIPGSKKKDDGGFEYSGPKEETEAEKAAAREKARLDKRKAAFNSFAESVKQTFGQIKESILSSFNLPSLGNSIQSVTRNIKRLLTQTAAFASNIAQLQALGLNPTLLQQIIAAGPVAGGQLAASLAAAGSSGIAGINASYDQFGGLASSIAGSGTTAAFGTQQTVNNYNINVRGGIDSGPSIGRAIVNAIRDYERQSGAAWRA